MTENYSQNSIVPPPERKVTTYDKPQKELNPPVYEGFQSWSDHVTVQTLGFDRFGHLWGAGHGGVIRWTISATEIKYKVWQSEHGIAGNDVQSLLICPDDRVVCGHNSGWLSIYQNGNWQVIDSKTNFPIRSLAVAPSGAILACTDVGLFDVDAEELASNIPAPPLCAVTAFGQLWIGTESGLFYKDERSWNLLEMEKPFRVVTSLHFSGKRLWFAGFDGAAYLDESRKVARIMNKQPVYALAPISGRALLATDDGILVYTEASTAVQKMSHHPAHAIVVKDHEVFQTTPNNVLCIDHKNKKQRWLLPERENTLGEITNVFEEEGVVYVQATDSSIWHESERGWTKVIDENTPALSGVAVFHNTLYFGFNSSLGVCCLSDGELKQVSRLPFVRNLETHDGFLVVNTLYGLFITENGSDWQQCSGTNGDVKVVFAKRGNFVLQSGVYCLVSGDLQCVTAFADTCIAAAYDENVDQLLVVFGDRVEIIEKELVIDSVDLLDIFEITSGAKYHKGTLLGTRSGLHIISNWIEVLDVSSSGLAGNTVRQISKIGNKCWIFTNAGTTILV